MLTSVKKLFWDWDARNLRSLRNASTHLENVAFAIQTRVAFLSGSHDVSSFINNATYYHIALQKRRFVFRNVKTEMITKDVFSREKLCHVVGCGGAFFPQKKGMSGTKHLCSTFVFNPSSCAEPRKQSLWSNLWPLARHPSAKCRDPPAKCLRSPDLRPGINQGRSNLMDLPGTKLGKL